MLTVRDLMVSDMVTLDAQDSLKLAAEVLLSAEVGAAPVFARGHLVGIVSLTEILAFESDDARGRSFEGDGVAHYDEAEAEKEIESRLEAAGDSVWFHDIWESTGKDRVGREDRGAPQSDPLAEHVVAEAMSRKAVWISPDAAIGEAARLMQEKAVPRLVVMDGGEAVGLLTTADLARTGPRVSPPERATSRA